MTRRDLLRLGGSGFAGLAMTQRYLLAQQKAQLAVRGMPIPRIRDVKVIATSPENPHLVVAKVITDQDGLYGYGCASFNRGADLVVEALEKYTKPFVIGKPVDRIEDLWQAMYDVTYWRNGPVLNNAISGIDQALWDIKGKMAGMPVYELLGGKCREAAECYSHADGAEISQVIDKVRAFQAEGFRNVRVQVAIPGFAAYSTTAVSAAHPASLHDDRVFEPAPYVKRTLQLFEQCRKELGDEVGLLHDVHERLPPTMAVQFAKDVEKFRLFFMEDPLAPEDNEYFRLMRQHSTTPIAMGELFNNPHEWTPLITNRLIDFIRIHVSQAGGLTPCRKIAALCETFGVRTAWHGPSDVSPIGHAAQLALDLTSYNFGIQEYSGFSERTREVFHNCPELKDGYLWANEAPGWGMEIDEKAAAKYPLKLEGHSRGVIRRRDGTVIKQ